MTGSETVGTTAVVLAQAAPAPGGTLGQFIPIILVFIVFYFILIRPQQKKQKEHQALVEGLKKNDRVVTIGGLHGRILEVGDGDVTIEISKGVAVRHERSQIGTVVTDRKKEE
jgi:preprotein translocase subunit YajC